MSAGGLAALLMGCAAGAVDLYLGAAWSSATDIGGSSGGAVAGLMNAASNCAGFASPALMGWVCSFKRLELRAAARRRNHSDRRGFVAVRESAPAQA